MQQIFAVKGQKQELTESQIEKLRFLCENRLNIGDLAVTKEQSEKKMQKRLIFKRTEAAQLLSTKKADIANFKR